MSPRFILASVNDALAEGSGRAYVKNSNHTGTAVRRSDSR